MKTKVIVKVAPKKAKKSVIKTSTTKVPMAKKGGSMKSKGC